MGSGWSGTLLELPTRTLAVIYLLLARWFRTQGGYRVLRIGMSGEVEAVPPSHGG